MQPRYDILAAMEREEARNTPVDYDANLQLFDAMIDMATALGSFPPEDPFNNLDRKIALNRILNDPRIDQITGESTR